MSVIELRKEITQRNLRGSEEAVMVKVADEIERVENESGGLGTPTIVNVSAAQLLDFHNNSINFLAAAGVDSYNDIQRIVLEFTPGATPYTSVDETFFIDVGGNSSLQVSTDLFKSGKAVVIINQIEIGKTGTGDPKIDTFVTNQPCIMYPFANPLLSGDGTLTVKIWSNPVTF